MSVKRVAEARQRLWIVPGPLVVWALHFMACYITAALWCGPAVPGGGSQAPWLPFALYTVAALLAIGAIGWLGYRSHRLGDASAPHDADSPADRHRFIGLATLLIAGLAFVSVIYSAMAVFMVPTCQ